MSIRKLDEDNINAILDFKGSDRFPRLRNEYDFTGFMILL